MAEDMIELPGDSDLWVIQIGGGYGAFLFRGNEADAEFMRAGKARWEGAFGHKWRADDPTFGGAPSGVRGNRKLATEQALASDPGDVTDWRNYGRSPKSEAALKALAQGERQ